MNKRIWITAIILYKIKKYCQGLFIILIWYIIVFSRLSAIIFQAVFYLINNQHGHFINYLLAFAWKVAFSVYRMASWFTNSWNSIRNLLYRDQFDFENWLLYQNHMLHPSIPRCTPYRRWHRIYNGQIYRPSADKTSYRWHCNNGYHI